VLAWTSRRRPIVRPTRVADDMAFLGIAPSSPSYGIPIRARPARGFADDGEQLLLLDGFRNPYAVMVAVA